MFTHRRTKYVTVLFEYLCKIEAIFENNWSGSLKFSEPYQLFKREQKLGGNNLVTLSRYVNKCCCPKGAPRLRMFFPGCECNANFFNLLFFAMCKLTAENMCDSCNFWPLPHFLTRWLSSFQIPIYCIIVHIPIP